MPRLQGRSSWPMTFPSSKVSCTHDNARSLRQKDALLSRMAHGECGGSSCKEQMPGPFFGARPSRGVTMRKLTGIAAAILIWAMPAAAQKVGEVGVDWLGN